MSRRFALRFGVPFSVSFAEIKPHLRNHDIVDDGAEPRLYLTRRNGLSDAAPRRLRIESDVTRCYDDAFAHFDPAIAELNAGFWSELHVHCSDAGLVRLFGGVDERATYYYVLRRVGQQPIDLRDPMSYLQVFVGGTSTVVWFRDTEDDRKLAMARLRHDIDEIVAPRTEIIRVLSADADRQLVADLRGTAVHSWIGPFNPRRLRIETPQRTYNDTYDGSVAVVVHRCRCSERATELQKHRGARGIVFVADAGPDNEFVIHPRCPSRTEYPPPDIYTIIASPTGRITVRVVHNWVLDVALALGACMAPYELLEVVDRMPDMNLLSRSRKTAILHGVADAHRAAEERRSATTARRSKRNK